ncbi:TetR/AcrR family transcriptional regulator [Novosphingobium sp.]|uniref:TetR/AcrR family transcriptional regulator n=1 Tax=Novosphingobium sp. TaxID=1874826 RepID=UPI003D1199A0
MRACLLDAAQAEFMEAGFAGASISRIVERSGRSKPTLFRHFATKRALFEGVVERIAGRWADAVNWQSIRDDTPAGWLGAFGARVLAWITNEDNIFVGRMAVSEGFMFPDIGERYLALAISPMRQVLTDRLGDAAFMGTIRCGDPARASQAFFDLVVSGQVSRLLYNPSDRDDADEVARHIAFCVNLFLHGLA